MPLNPLPIRTTVRLLLLASAGLLLQACQDTNDSGPPADASVLEGEMPAFRSVLDGKPRMLTLQMDDEVRLAYDTQAGHFYKAWWGDVDLKGIVYDTRHGPQPETQGAVYLTQTSAQWQSGEAEMTYAGHRFAGRQILLMYELAGDGWTAQLEEEPSTRRQGEGMTLTRKFRLQGLPEGQTLELAGLTLPQDYELSGNAEWTGDQSLALANGSAELVLTFASAEVPAQAAEQADQHPGLTLIENSDCAACHNPENKTVGPSYLSIAERYIDQEGAIGRLAQKIIDGGSGNWGQVPMTAHPDLSREDAETMVAYIFSLVEEAEAEPEEVADPRADQWLMDQPGLKLTMEAKTPELDDEVNGVMVYLHHFDSDRPNVELMRTNPPAKAGRLSRLHLPDPVSFAPLRHRFALQVKTRLTLDKPLETTLRVVSDDGSYLYLNGEQVVDNWGFQAPTPGDVKVSLGAGEHPLEIIYFQGTGGASLSLQWRNPKTDEFEVIPESMLSLGEEEVRRVVPVVTDEKLVKSIPGDQSRLEAVHPAFDLHQARPEEFEPMVGGIDFMPDGRMVVSTWDPEGSVYLVSNYTADPQKIEVKRIARGLAEPLGVKVVDGDIYVMQKQELTRLVDINGDEVIDRYENLANDWSATANFHEFGFGLEYEDGHFYATLATAILPGGASADPQAPDRGKVMKVRKSDGAIQFIASGLRTPNGIGYGIDGKLFIADNQGDWLPSSKIVELTEGAWYGSRSVDFEGTANLTETKPVVWLPQDEIGNSPSEPAPLNLGPYQNQMIHGEVTHGGIKRVYAERINGRLQGAVFRFIQGLEAGVNRLDWAPDDSLIVGGVGNPGNWGDYGKQWFGLQRLTYNGNDAFEMLKVSARSDGFVIDFTQPIRAGQNISPEDFEIQQWYYQPTAEYGGPKKDLRPLPVEGFSMSEDRTQLRFKLGGLKEDHVVYFRIKRPFASASDQSLWTTEAWYTLNALPESKPVQLEPGISPAHNQLTEAERAQGWELLFDGQSLEGLRNYNAETLGELWGIDQGALHFEGRESGSDAAGGDVVITPEPYDNYELYLEWKLAPGGNSGIIYNVQESPELDYPYMSGPEYQLLDNIAHPDGQIDKHRAGDLYDLIAARPVTVNPVGEWNRSRLVVNQGRIQHWLNGFKVVETNMNDADWDAMIAASKFQDWPAFGKNTGGHVVLQDHDDPVWFRNIKIRSLDN